jgi:hypothetical protein
MVPSKGSLERLGDDTNCNLSTQMGLVGEATAVVVLQNRLYWCLAKEFEVVKFWADTFFGFARILQYRHLHKYIIACTHYILQFLAFIIRIDLG